MLAIRLQRTGRKGHAMFRLVVQDARRTPTSGKVVAWLGSYDPHNKSVNLDKDKAQFYLSNGAQPSGRVVSLMIKEGLKLPKWVRLNDSKKRAIKNPEKRRSTRPANDLQNENQVNSESDNSQPEQATDLTEQDQKSS